MKRYSTVIALVALLAVLGACSTTSAAYRVQPSPVVAAGAHRVVVPLFVDLRSEEEKAGAGAGLFNKSTKDSLYESSVAEAITLAMIDELRARGLDAQMRGEAPYRVTAEIRSYRALIVPPRVSFVPYINYVTWLWTKDRISAGVEIDVKLEGPGGVLLSDIYRLNANTEEWVGLAGLASRARSLDNDHLVQILRAGLKDVLTRAADDIAARTAPR